MADTEQKNYGYGKKPLWQWVVIYLVVGGIIYALVYYLFLAKKRGYSYNNSYVTPTNAMQQNLPTSVQTSPTEGSQNNIYMSKTDSVKGTYLTDFAGMTLYIFDKDTKSVSNCYNGCAQAWPPYTSGATTQSTFPANITVIKRTDGNSQFAWMGKPLYYYASDQKTGEINGDGVGGIWHIVKL